MEVTDRGWEERETRIHQKKHPANQDPPLGEGGRRGRCTKYPNQPNAGRKRFTPDESSAEDTEESEEIGKWDTETGIRT